MSLLQHAAQPAGECDASLFWRRSWERPKRRAEFITALDVGAQQAMQSDPPPSGPEYVVHFYPNKPHTWTCTLCVALTRTQGSTFRVSLTNFAYSDRCLQPGMGLSCSIARCIGKDEDWLVDRADEPEDDALSEQFLKRRLEHQRSAKTAAVHPNTPMLVLAGQSQCLSNIFQS